MFCQEQSLRRKQQSAVTVWHGNQNNPFDCSAFVIFHVITMLESYGIRFYNILWVYSLSDIPKICRVFFLSVVRIIRFPPEHKTYTPSLPIATFSCKLAFTMATTRSWGIEMKRKKNVKPNSELFTYRVDSVMNVMYM